MRGTIGKGFVVGVSAATAAIQGVTGILAGFLPSAAKVTATNVSLCGAIVLRVSAVSHVALTGLESRVLFRVSQSFI